MKSTESLEVAGQLMDSPGASSEMATSVGTSTPDSKRRRLVRGAVALAPLVLTLRSGALAAASCTGAKTVATALGENGLIDTGVGAMDGDVCFKRSSTVNVCAEHPDTKLENPMGAPTESDTVSGGKCGNFTKDTNVAILSSTSATSFLT